ncbi:MAG: alpha/beta hydrolase [Sphingomonadales bacterium]|nr:alpha/beta hydrolase [Sphingomonadales bacterium]
MRVFLAALSFASLIALTTTVVGSEEIAVITTDTKQKTVLYRHSHALVIGIDNYTGGWPVLRQARADAMAIAAELDRHGFSVKVVTDSDMVLDKAAIKNLIDDFIYGPGTKPDSRLLIWFAGHGHTIDGEGYIVPQNAPHPEAGPIEHRPLVEAQFRRHSLSLRDFGGYMRETRAKHVLAIFDSCFGGTVFDVTRSATGYDITTAAATGQVRQFVSSGDAEQEVSDDGLFRKLFIDAIDGSDAEADTNKDGLLTATELGRYLTFKVTSYKGSTQTPRYGRMRERALDRGEFVFKLSTGQAVAKAPPKSESFRAPTATASASDPLFARRGSGTSLYFITDRQRDKDPRIVGFTGDRGQKLTVGKTIVRSPTFWDRILSGAASRSSSDTPVFDGLAIVEPEDLLTALPSELDRSLQYPKQVLVYLHGYNVSFDDAFLRGAQLTLRVGFDGPTFVYSWPSTGSIVRYLEDFERANAAGSLFARFIDWLVRRTEVEAVNVIAQGMGGKILLSAVDAWKRADDLTKQKIGHLIFIAPDVDRDVFASSLADRQGVGRSATLYVANNDRALAASKALLGQARAGDLEDGHPLIIKNVETVDISSVGSDFFATGSASPLSNSLALSDVSLVLRGRAKTAGRLPVFERVDTASGSYWRWKGLGSQSR